MQKEIIRQTKGLDFMSAMTKSESSATSWSWKMAKSQFLSSV